MSAPRPQTHRFSVADFYKMEESGALHPEARVELLDGVVHDMFPITPIHAALVDELGALLMEQRAGRYQLRIQGPLKLDDFNMVLPDVMPLRLKDDRYRYRAPRADDALLVIEVADSSFSFDQRDKLPRYARAGIAEVWIVNVPERQVEVYREPTALNYASTTILQPGQSAVPDAFPDISIPVAELFR